jgi:hypothetical protein
VKRALAFVGLAFFFALPVYFGVSLWNEQELLRKVRQLGIQTDGVVTKLKFSRRINWGATWFVDYDYVAAGLKRHGSITSGRSPAASEGEHIPVTYVSGEPDLSLPFGQRDLALSDDPLERREEHIAVFLLTLIYPLTFLRGLYSRRRRGGNLKSRQSNGVM